MSKEFASTESTPAPIAGCLFGLFVGIGFFVLSAIFLFWFWPLLFFTALGIVIAPLMGLSARKGPCPHCSRNLFITMGKASKCPSCAHRIEIRDTKFVDLSS